MAKARIMVVEDEGVVALQISEALKGLGYEVPVVAMTGEEAVAKLLETEPDLVLMDIHLKGGLSGVEAAKRIRTRLDVPVIYLTAYSDAETLEQAQLTEPYGYVLKPFEEKSLHAIIQMSLLKHRRTRGIRENGWWMSAVAASMMEAVLICDPKGYIKFANPSAETLLRKSRQDMLEKRMSEMLQLIDAETRAPLAFPVTEPLLEGKSTLRANCRLVAGEEREIPVEFSASPLRSPEGTLFGILYVFRETSERERIQNVVLRQMEELAVVQKRLLPSRDTAIPGLRFEWLFIPTTLGGGDALGFVRLDDEHTAFYALDVVGQGVVSSLFSLVLHMFLSPHPDAGGILAEKTRESSRARILTPAEVVKSLANRFYLRDDTNPYFTMTYGVIEPATGKARIVRAGHPFPLLQRADGSVLFVRTEGYAVGLFPGADVASEEIVLGKGDRLFLYSDGLMDSANPAGASFGALRLEDTVKAGRERPLSEVVQSLRQALVAWRGSESFSDDVSLLAVEKE
ncbi:MAG: SpoIIE family protein phosphatase [Spirochaetia bacterium]|jgi:serine phosphatase RsbU (regulator of sigma subunit)/DNA-binding response OmpR family regulator